MLRPSLTSCASFVVVFWLASAAARCESGDAAEQNLRLGRGINLGNALEAPNEGEWGFTLREEYFPIIRDAGFDSVRIPIRWSAHAQKRPPYRIEPKFFDRVDWAIEEALSSDLRAVINIHHYEEMYGDPLAEKQRFLALWRQIAERYRDQPRTLYFEILNEPHEKLTAEIWNDVLRQALAVIRKSHPDRTVIVGPAQWNNLEQLPNLKLPKDDRNLIVTFHYYSPFEFTHQGASWAEGSEKWLGTPWPASPTDEQAVQRDFDKAAAWGRRENRPLYLGEFGAYSAAEMESRARWTRYVRKAAESRGISWAYWEFGSGFGAYDPMKQQWRAPLRQALLSDAAR